MFTSFIKPVQNLLIQHPGVAFASAFAAVGAPGFLKDEHRGYFRTALVTTPIVAAMGIAGPGLVTSASRAARSGYRFVREMPQFFNKNLSINYKDLRNFMEDGGIDLGTINPALRTWVDDAAIDFFSHVDRGAPPIEHSLDSAMTIFNRLMPDDGKRALLSYAVEGARQRAASPVQLAGVGRQDFITAMSDSDLREIVNVNKADPKFVEEFSRRLRWVDRLKDSGAFANPIKNNSTKTVGLSFSEGMNLLQSQRPEVAAALESAVRQGVVDSATIVAEQTVDGSIGRLLGVNLKRQNEELRLPLFDPSTGTIRVGDDFQRLGVGRRLYSKAGVADLDVFVASNLSQNWNALKIDIGRAGYFGGVDPLNEYKMITHGDSQLATLSPHAMILRSRAAVPTSTAMFEGGKTFNELSMPERMGLFRDMLSQKKMTRIGSEGGTAKGVFEFAESELFTVGGLPSLSKQGTFYRSFSKELQLAPGDIPSGWRPRVTTSAVEALGGVPEVRMAVAGISAQQKSLFGDLPADIKDLAGYDATAIDRIMKDTGLGQEAATQAWNKIRGKLTGRNGYYSAARKLGGLGEGGIILHEKFARLGMEARTTTRVNQLHIDPNEFKDKAFGPNQLIGFSGIEPITSNAPQTFVEGVSSVGGAFELTLRQRFPVETGAKVDVAGVKGLAILAKEDQFSRIRELMNLYGEATGAPVSIPNFADAIAPLNYTAGKVGDPFRTLLEQAAEVSAQISTHGTAMSQAMQQAGIGGNAALDEVNKYMFDLAGQGIYAHTDLHTRSVQFVEDSNFVQGVDRAERMRSITGCTEQFLESVGGLALQKAPGTESGLFSAFRRSHMSNLTSYMQQNAMVSSAAFWDSTRRNVPQMTTATFDLFSEMFRGGHVEGMREIMSRLDFQGGSPEMAAKFAQNFVQQDYMKPLGTVIPIGEAAPGGVHLSNMAVRAGSIFDPTRPDLQENYSLALKEPIYARVAGRDLEVSHIPVLGKMAYGGGANLFEKPGEGLAYGATDYEKSLAEVVKWQSDPVKLSAAVSEHLSETYRTLFGKQGFYRAKGTDVAGAVSGFLQTRALPSPFHMSIPEQVALRIRDKGIRESLLAGGEVMATAARHPIQAAPYMRVRVAPEAGLGPNMIGMDESIRGLFGADDDKDILNLFFYRNGSQAEREALAAVNNLDSNQWKSFRTLEMLYGGSEDSRNIARTGIKSLPELVEKGLAAGGTTEGRIQQVTKRMASGTVGAYSNLVSKLYTNIEMHPNIGGNPESRMLLGHMFWPVRQFSIAIAKSQGNINPEDAMIPYKRITAGLNARSPQGVDEVIAGMKDVYNAFDKKSILTDQAANIYTNMAGKPGMPGQEVSALMDILESEKGRSLISDFVVNRNIQADRATSLLTKNVAEMEGDSLYALQAMYKEMGSSVPYLQGLVKNNRSGGLVSKVLGALNETTRSAAREAGKGLLPTLALGFGLSAAAAVLTSHVKDIAPVKASFGNSGGMFRPEQATQVTDRPNGETMPGSMSSVNPPRRQLPARSGTTTAIVAPMRQRSDLEVNVRAQDRTNTVEMQRMVQQMSNGNGIANTTINYQQGWRTKMSKLRQRETIREQLES